MTQSLRYKSITSINGPLVVVNNVQGVKLNELVEIEVGDETRVGQVVELQGNVAIIQVLQGTAG
ncbi:MAG: V-type ATP synthase subunit B, partial [Thermoproteota archaeon]